MEAAQHTNIQFTVFLVKQFLDLLSKDYFLPHAVNVIIICRGEESHFIFKLKFQIKQQQENVSYKTFSTHHLWRRRPSLVK